MTDLVLGLALFGTALFALGLLIGVRVTMGYVGSLGWERDGAYSINEDTKV